MTTLKDTCKNLNLTLSIHTAMSGSKYYRVNGVKFRISDHDQPSHYQVKNYFDVCSENCIIDIISNELFSFYANPIEREDGFANAIYNRDNDTFKIVSVSKKEYDILVEKMEDRKKFYIQKNYQGTI